MTNDSGGHWFRDDGNPQNVFPPPATSIPDIPVLRMMVDINDRSGQTVLAGTDIGVFSKHRSRADLGAIQPRRDSYRSDFSISNKI